MKNKKKINNITTFLIILGLLLTSFFPFSNTNAASFDFTKIELTNIDNDIATFKWSTNFPAQGWFQIGENKSIYTQTISAVEFDNHQQAIVRLPKEDITYFYRVIAENTEGARITSFEFNFKVKDFTDDTLPKFINIPKILYKDSSTVYLTWETDEKTTSRLYYSQKKDLSDAKKIKGKSNKENITKVKISKLNINTVYYFEVIIIDDSGNEAKTSTLSFSTKQFNDQTDLHLINQKPLSNNSNEIKDSEVKMSWLTSKPSICNIYYGEKGRTSKKINEKGLEKIDHKFLISDLSSDTEYTYYIYCKDILGKKLKTERTTLKTRSPKVLGFEYTKNLLVEKFMGQEYRLVTTNNNPNIYAIVNKQKYLIKSPNIFKSYNFSWNEVETITDKALNKYSDAQLVKTIKNPSVYYLYNNYNRKKSLLSEIAFKSYRGNSWKKVILVNKLDLNQYRDLVLVKEKNNPTVYLIQNNIKKPIKSWDVLVKHKLDDQPIGIISKKDLDSYITSSMLE